MFFGHAEQFAHHLRPVAQVLLDEFGANNAQESGGGLVRNRFRQQRFSRARRTVQDDPLWRLDANFLVEPTNLN